jgi:hypothetical protein
MIDVTNFQSELAQQFFGIANAITVFCLLQTAAFLLTFSKDLRIVAALLRWRPYSSAASKHLGKTYLIGVMGCGVAEVCLRYQAKEGWAVLATCVFAVALRCGAIFVAHTIYLRIFVAVCREEDWLNKHRPEGRELQTPRVEPKRSQREKRVYYRARKIDRSLFQKDILKVVQAKDFRQWEHFPK